LGLRGEIKTGNKREKASTNFIWLKKAFVKHARNGPAGEKAGLQSTEKGRKNIGYRKMEEKQQQREGVKEEEGAVKGGNGGEPEVIRKKRRPPE